MDKIKLEIGLVCCAQWLVDTVSGEMEMAVVTIKGLSDDMVWFEYSGVHHITNLKNCSFSPKKSRVDIEREEAADVMRAITCDTVGMQQCFEALYDAGYRKVGDKVDINEEYSLWVNGSTRVMSFPAYSQQRFDIFKKVKL